MYGVYISIYRHFINFYENMRKITKMKENKIAEKRVMWKNYNEISLGT